MWFEKSFWETNLCDQNFLSSCVKILLTKKYVIELCFIFKMIIFWKNFEFVIRCIVPENGKNSLLSPIGNSRKFTISRQIPQINYQIVEGVLKYNTIVLIFITFGKYHTFYIFDHTRMTKRGCKMQQKKIFYSGFQIAITSLIFDIET